MYMGYVKSANPTVVLRGRTKPAVKPVKTTNAMIIGGGLILAVVMIMLSMRGGR